MRWYSRARRVAPWGLSASGVPPAAVAHPRFKRALGEGSHDAHDLGERAETPERETEAPPPLLHGAHQVGGYGLLFTGVSHHEEPARAADVILADSVSMPAR